MGVWRNRPWRFRKFNDNYKYFLTVFDVFSKYLHIFPLKSKSGTAVTSAFKSILENTKYSKPLQKHPVWVRTDKWKEFLNRHLQDMLKSKSVQLQVSRNPDVKCSIFERAKRTSRDRLYKFFTYSNTNRDNDILQKFVDTYNDTVHTTTGMAPSNLLIQTYSRYGWILIYIYVVCVL